MRPASHFFFYTYIGLVVAAGFWGAFINPYFDFRLLFGMDINSLQDTHRINLLSQYRFLRALELGFGIFALLFKKEIFSHPRFNLLFLLIMGSGIMARLVSIVADGIPNFLALFFMGYELIGWIIIYLYTRGHKLQALAPDR
ncbi:DUF4345 domain-containing protein [Flavihumibacter sp. R14]|nr:DUF4345 domain-containing protein [Flavihumibacter soli]